MQDGTKLIMWDCVDNAVGQEFTFDGDRLMYDGKCATWSNTGVTLESCSSDENQDIEVMFNKQYTHNIKFTGFGDYCLTGHSGSDAKDRVVYGESRPRRRRRRRPTRATSHARATGTAPRAATSSAVSATS